jgi:serine/threonine protein kinase
VQVLHSRGIQHGGLKPSNILIAAGFQLKVADWGVQRVLHQERGFSAAGNSTCLPPEGALHLSNTCSLAVSALCYVLQSECHVGIGVE